MKKLFKEAVQKANGRILEETDIVFDNLDDFDNFLEELGYPDYEINGNPGKYYWALWFSLDFNVDELQVYVKGGK